MQFLLESKNPQSHSTEIPHNQPFAHMDGSEGMQNADKWPLDPQILNH
jgi:hypothetical protein